MASCLDGICYYHTQKKIKWCLIASAIVLTVLTTIVLVVLRFAVTPHIVANVEDARLNAFAFSTTQGSSSGTTEPFFSYNVSVALTVRNPNQAMSIKHTKPLVATLVFHDRRLRNLTILDGGYRHRPGKEEPLCFNATGEIPAFRLGDAAAEDFRKQNTTGLFTVEMRLSGEITYKGIAIAKKSKLSLSCPLRLQLAPPGPEIVEFHEVRCEHVKEAKIYF